MDKKNLMPQQAQPINRITLGQLPSELTELSEETLNEVFGSDNSGILAQDTGGIVNCSHDGDDAD